jgi:hypothetical protein
MFLASLLGLGRQARAPMTLPDNLAIEGSQLPRQTPSLIEPFRRAAARLAEGNSQPRVPAQPADLARQSGGISGSMS